MSYLKDIFQLADASDDIDAYDSDITESKNESFEEELDIVEKKQ